MKRDVKNIGMHAFKTAASAAIAALMLAAPSTAMADEITLRVAYDADLVITDPMGPTDTQGYQHAMRVYDTLFAADADLKPQPQMVDSWKVSDDKLKYTFVLRDGLKFSDGTDVTSADVVPSLKRWMVKDVVGRTTAIDVDSITGIDPKTFEITLKRPFPLLYVLANNSSGLPVVMRKQEAEGGDFTGNSPIIGSGPFIFDKAAWKPGDTIVYRKNPLYLPRKEPPSGFSGGKTVKIDRLEIKVMPDSSSAATALQSGQVDFIDALPFDQGAILKADPNITIGTAGIFNPFFLRPNALFPPFDNAKARQALAMAVNQAEFMAVAFANSDWGKPCLSYFVCGTPGATTAGSEPYATPNLKKARELLKESGYKGEPVVLLNSPAPQFISNAVSYAAQALKEIGLNVQVANSDWGTLVARRNSKKPPDQGGWNLFITSLSGSGAASPLTSTITDTTCGGNNFAGWPCDQAATDLKDAYIHEGDPAKQKAVLDKLSARLWEVVPTVILGQRAQLYAWRKGITGFVRTPSLVTVYWNIEKKQ